MLWQIGIRGWARTIKSFFPFFLNPPVVYIPLNLELFALPFNSNTVHLKKKTVVFEYRISNKECRIMKLGKDFCYFDIHYSLFDILRFKTICLNEQYCV